MARFIEFLINHWILSGIWLILLFAFLAYQKSKSGKSLSPHQTTLLINKEKGVVLDVRDKKAFENGHIAEAVNIPLAKLKDRVVELEKNKNIPIIVVCPLGQQSGDAVKILEENGFTQVSRLKGGINEWEAQSLPLVK